jgi:hypothetical protein
MFGKNQSATATGTGMPPTRRLAVVRSALVLSLLAIAFGAAQGTASAAPQASFSVTCAIGGQTTVSWQHARVNKLQIDWYNPATTVFVAHPTVAGHAPNGQLSMPTPDGATVVEVDFYSDTTENSITVTCS